MNDWITLLIYFCIWLFCILLPLWFVVKKAGYSPWFSLLVFGPLINIIAFYYFAFTPWPIQKEFELLQQSQS